MISPKFTGCKKVFNTNLLLAFITTFGFSQSNLEIEKGKGLELFENQRYDQAISHLDNRKLLKKDSEAKFILCVSLYQTNQLNKALSLFNELLAETKINFPESWWYKGKIYHARNQYSEAVKWYKVYLKSLPDNHPHRSMVRDAIRRCSNGIEFRYKESYAIVENFGNQVNTKYDEFAPIISPTRNTKIYFSSIRPSNMGGLRNNLGQIDEINGQPLADMYSCEKPGPGDWSNTQPMHYLLNSTSHDVLLDFDRSGKVLYYFKGWKLDQGEIFVDTFKQMSQRSISTTSFSGPLRSGAGDGMLYMANDTLLLFASKALSGYGGYDIYKSIYKHGVWSSPINLGPEINSPFDEITPFLARDLKTLYFSTNNTNLSIGGFDVVKSVNVQPEDQWIPPLNLGIPINSANDDTYFRLANDGFTGFLCSSRKDGYGQRDLYIAYFKEYMNEMEVTYQQPSRNNEIVENHDDYIKPEEDPFEIDEDNTTPVPPVNENNDPNKPEINTFVLSPHQELSDHQLFSIQEVLISNPSSQLVISSYKYNGQSRNQSIYESIKEAEKFGGVLIKNGVDPERIYLRGLTTESTDQIVFSFYYENTPLNSFDKDIPDLGTFSQSALIDNVPVNQNLFYKIQVVSLSGAYNGHLLENYDYPMVEKNYSSTYYRYTIGGFNQFHDAKSFASIIKSKEVREAYIVPYLYGKRIDRKTAKLNTNTFNDLLSYLSN